MILLKLYSCPAVATVARSQLTFLGANVLKTGQTQPVLVRTQKMANSARSGFGRGATRQRTLKESIMAPAGETAFSIGKGALMGASGLGIGALCYYGLGLSNEAGTLEKSMLWPQYVRDRVHSTYLYFGGSILLTAASAVAVSRSPALLGLMMKNSWLAIGATFAAAIGSGIVVRSIPYSEGLGTKQLAWMVHSGIIGAVVAPLCFLGGPLLVRAAVYTAGVIGGLSTVALCAPSEKFLNMSGPLAIGLGVVFVSSLGSMFLAPTTALGASLYSISMYGGLILFSGLMLYDTQRIIRAAESYPTYDHMRPYDPVNESISIYLDTVNIFIRIAMLLAGGGSSRK